MRHVSIFISHSWSNPNEYQKIRNLLRKNNIPILDFSVTKPKSLGDNIPKLILEDKLKKRVKRCQIFIVSATPNIKDSEWVENEVILAVSLGIFVLGIRPRNQKKELDPKYLRIATQKKYGKTIGFNSERILKTIYKVSKIDRELTLPKRIKKKRKVKKKSILLKFMQVIKKKLQKFDKWIHNKF